jgi:hypothetical protein
MATTSTFSHERNALAATLEPEHTDEHTAICRHEADEANTTYQATHSPDGDLEYDISTDLDEPAVSKDGKKWTKKRIVMWAVGFVAGIVMVPVIGNAINGGAGACYDCGGVQKLTGSNQPAMRGSFPSFTTAAGSATATTGVVSASTGSFDGEGGDVDGSGKNKFCEWWMGRNEGQCCSAKDNCSPCKAVSLTGGIYLAYELIYNIMFLALPIGLVTGEKCHCFLWDAFAGCCPSKACESFWCCGVSEEFYAEAERHDSMGSYKCCKLGHCFRQLGKK